MNIDFIDGMIMPIITAASDRVHALDNIITSANITIDSVARDETKLTDGLCTQYGIIIDHLPLIAHLSIT